MPDKEYHWRNSLTPATLPSTINWSNPDPLVWLRTQTFLEYDEHGNQTRILDASDIETTVNWDATGTLINSIITRPSATVNLTTTYGYDPNTFSLTTITDPNNQITEFKYDPLQRLIETISPDKRTTGNHSYYFSRDGNGGNFSATDPNYVQTTLSTHFEHVRNHDFENGSGATPTSWRLTNFDQGLGTWDNLNSFSGTHSLKADIPSASSSNRVRWETWPWYDEKISPKKNYRMEVWVITSTNYNGMAYFKLYVHDAADNYLATESPYIILTNTNNQWKKFTLDFTPGTNADHVYAVYLDFPYNGVGTIWYDRANFYELNITKTFADGRGRDIQSLQKEGSGSIKAGTIYDFANRMSKVTKPFASTDATFVLDPITAANSYYTGVVPYFPGGTSDTYPYAYSEIDYYAEPLNRVKNQYFPGTVFSKLGTGQKFIKHQYGINVANEMGLAANKVLEERVIDENGVKTEISMDTFGNKIAVRVDSSGVNNNENTTKLATAFRYNIVDNLTKVAPPKAFQPANNNIPDWGSAFCDSMTYNTLSQLTSRKTPDAGTTNYLYDKKGNLRFVKDAKGTAGNYFIYYKYDNLSRKIEEGTVANTANFTQTNADNTTYPTSGHTFKVKYHYDVAAYSPSATQRNLKGRLEAIEYVTDRYPNVKGYIFYSYDANGNIEWVEQHIPKSNVSDGNHLLVTKMDYQYDALGKVTKISFRRISPPGAASDAFYTWYDYDGLGRLEKIYTNTADSKPTTADALYTYWPGGQVKRLLLGNNVQGLDYLYNSRDWLTQMNHHSLTSSNDPGNDGANGITLDRFGQIIGYNVQGTHIANDPDYTSDFAAQFNGNISWTTHHTSTNTNPAGLTGWVFKYDKANRLIKGNWGYNTNPTGASWLASNNYDVTGITYDRNGNLDFMTRNNQSGTATNMDYIYLSNTNKLDRFSGLNGQAAGNYGYDANGNMTRDIVKLGSSSTITYDYRNLPTQVPKTPAPAGTIYFGYDGNGQRIFKNNLFYVPDADGKVIAVYDINGAHLYWNVWGLDLIGQRFWAQ